MKRILLIGLSLLIAGLCLLPTGSSTAQAPTTVEITPAAQTVVAGETFIVSVYVTPDEAIAGVGLDMSFNATLLQANSVTEGNLLKHNCSTFFFSGTINNTAGTINGIASAALIGGCVNTDPGIFANISFTARAVAGISSINMSNVIVGDAGGNPVSTTATNGSVTVITAGITVDPDSGLVTTEAAGQDTFTIVLDTQPTADVTVGLSSSDLTEGTVAPASVTFTTANWDDPQTVTVTGVDDDIDDDNVAYNIVTAAATSGDAKYNGLNAADVGVTNNDDDTAGITVDPNTGLVTDENAGEDTFTIVLDTEPLANVTINLSSSDLTEGTVAPASVTFTNANWDTPQTVTATGVDDVIIDGNIPYTIVTAAASSGDAKYDGLNADDAGVTNNDNDVAGITVNPTSGLVTTEAAGTATFTMVLNNQPSADVTVNLSSSDLTEGTVAPASVTFGTANWSTPQIVTATGVDDVTVDGNIPYTIVTAAASSADGNYNSLIVADVAVTNNDNDTPGITVNPTAGLVTTEAGGTATFTIVLNTQPTANVIIGISSGDITEGTVAPTSVTFSTANWSTLQTITVTGVDDAIDDNNVAYTIVTAAATSADGNYNGINPSNVTATNTDDDTAGITVDPTSGLVTTEAAGTDTFTIVLDSQPLSNVRVILSSSDTTEGTVAPTSVTFTNANWNTPQTVTVTGVNDAIDDGDIPYTIVTAAATSTDPKYSGMVVDNVGATNTDNDTAGITVNPVSGLVTTEAAGKATFTIVLDTQPTASVTIGLSSSDTTEGTVSPASVIFTTSNWGTARTITITGINDVIDDGDIPYTIITAAATSTDPTYNGMNAADAGVTNIDNDGAGITVTPTSGLVTTEAAVTDTFTIVLNTQPAADVTINLSSSDLTEGTVAPAGVTFTNANWNTPQTVTVTGVDDFTIDGNIPYTIVTAAASSADGNYNNLDAADVGVTNNDNDVAGITVTPTSGLVTTEAADTATFTIVLNTQPAADVTINLSSSDLTEGTVAPAGVTFTNANWNTPQTVTVTGVDDPVMDGNIAYTIVTAPATSTVPGYNGLNAADVGVTNTDDDVAGITVDPVAGLVTTEAGGTDTFTIVLNTQPTADVRIGLTSGDTTEGIVSPASATFTTANWDTPQTITITGVDDAIDDGDIAYTIVTAPATSTDTRYRGINAADVGVTNNDDDTMGITVTPTSGLFTTEAAGTATFTIVLNTQPTANVVIGLSSSDLTEGTVAPASVTFTAANWNTPQTVTVTGVDDAIVDGSVAYTIVTAAVVSDDIIYDGYDPVDVGVTNTDNETPGITVNPTSGLITTEAAGTDTFTIVLNTQPAADVTINLSSSDLTEGTVAPASVTFTAANWNTPQTVTVTGVDDLDMDGNIAYNIVTAAAASADGDYNGMDASDVGAANTDDDIPGITVTPTSGLITTEAGGTATFTIVLDTQPTADVTVDLSSSDTNEGTVAPASVTFTGADWNTPQTVTVTGVNDLAADGDTPYLIITAAAASTDTDYDGLNPADVSVTNRRLGGGGGGGGGGSYTMETPISITILGVSVTGSLDPSGIFQSDVDAASSDGEITVHIAGGVTALNEDGSPLTQMTIDKIGTCPPPPDGRTVIAAFDFQPNGATFNPAIQITIEYDPATLPAGTDVSQLVIAFYNEDSGQWEYVSGTVNPDTNTITFLINHYTIFSVMGAAASSTAPEETPTPTPTVEPTIQPTPTPTAMPSPTVSPEPTPTATLTPTPDDDGGNNLPGILIIVFIAVALLVILVIAISKRAR